ncbi:MAG: isochorismatase family protein [Bacteroidales bacterium]|nr:isochorismatase family protein [Bacteroidales bacterium]
MAAKVMLLIVDPQNDFIEGGALAVKGAKKAMQDLANFLAPHPELFPKIFVTQDFHPEDHCSFTEQGGTWPKHCVRDTSGAEIFPPLKAVLDKCPDVEYCKKGESKDRDQYSVFDIQNGEISNEYGKKIQEYVKSCDTCFIFVAGIAGDVCVMNTLKDLIQFADNKYIIVYRNFTASLDGGKKLEDFCQENSITIFSIDRKNETNN